MDAGSLVGKIDRVVELAIYYLAALMLIALTVVIGYAVFMRYAFARAPDWSEEVPRVIFLWLTYLAIAVAVKRGQNLRVMFLIVRFSPRTRLWLEMFMHACVFLMLAWLLWHNFPVIELNSSTRMLATGWSDAVRFWPLSIGCLLMALYQIRQVLRSFEEYRRGAARG